MPYRIASPQQRRAYYLLLVAGAMAGIVALGLAITQRIAVTNTTLTGNRTEIRVVCGRVQQLEGVIVAVLRRTLSTFGQPGTSGYEYYRAHPAELVAGRVALKNEIGQFASAHCR